MTPQSPDDQRFRQEIDAVIGRFSGGNAEEQARRWQQLAGWARNQGNPRWKRTLKRRLLKERGASCADCHRECAPAELQMHRENDAYALDRKRKFGYLEDNITLLCISCHQLREGAKREARG